jgi:hypothetical protein
MNKKRLYIKRLKSQFDLDHFKVPIFLRTHIYVFYVEFAVISLRKKPYSKFTDVGRQREAAPRDVLQ